MSEEIPQGPLAALEGRRFSFYPAIRGIEHNEWTLEESTWSEARVRNCQTGGTYWIPKGHLGSVSTSDSPVLILGLVREFEAKAGGIFPARSVVTETPSTPSGRKPSAVPAPAPPRRNALLGGSDARTLRLLAIAIGSTLLAAVVGFIALAGGLHNPFEALFEPDTSTSDQRYLGLAAGHGYFDVVDHLAEPESEQWISEEEDELQFQALLYPERGYTIILMGGTRSGMRYLGTLHEPSRKVLDSAELARGGDTSPLMRNLPDF